jgi:aryl-alcohol dehydrogenase-like predicted oxidoreductase
VARAQVATAWILQKNAVIAPIIGASKSGHIADAVASLSIKLTPEEIQALESPYIPHGVAGFK